MRILFVYGFEPSGHASAARALEAAASAAGHECSRVNVSGSFHRRLGPLIARLYLGLIARFPGAWRRLYDNEPVARIVSYWRWVYRLFFGDKLRAALIELAPDAVVCTHAPPLGAIALEKKAGVLKAPLVAVVTDFRVHTYWITPEAADLYVTALPDPRLPEGKVAATGIPIHPLFETPEPKAQARARLGLPPDAPVVVLSGGSRGLGRLSALARVLLDRLPRARVLAVCGSNARLAHELKALALSREGRLWVYENATIEQMRDLESAADLLIGKAGGVTMAECLALGLPLVLFEPIPGQERRNADFLLEHGAAVEAGSVADAAAQAERLLEPEAHAAASARARALGRPDAARRALAAVVEMAR